MKLFKTIKKFLSHTTLAKIYRYFTEPMFSVEEDLLIDTRILEIRKKLIQQKIYMFDVWYKEEMKEGKRSLEIIWKTEDTSWSYVLYADRNDLLDEERYNKLLNKLY